MLKNKSERGITLVALVITIIIIIILATVTINMAFGDNGLITQAQKAKDMTANSIAAEQEGMNSVMSEYLNVMAEDSEITPPDIPEEPEFVDVLPTKPSLSDGMTPVKYVENTGWVRTTSDDEEWYDYANKEWANVVLGDASWNGEILNEDETYSMLVWIPRYAYQITSGYHQSGAEINPSDGTTGAGTIEIVFIDTNNQNKEKTTTYSTSYPSISGTSMSSYVVHPAFNYGGTALSGFWVGKYETSHTGCTMTASTGTSNTNVTTLTPMIKAGVTSWRMIQISNIFTVCTNMNANGNPYGLNTSDNVVDPHMMKNSEWGAVAYLSQNTTYGKESEVWINPNNDYITGQAGSSVSASSTTSTNAYNTTNGSQASTTGNVTGVYDMSGGAYEYVAAYLNNGNSYLTTYGSTLVSASDKYKEVYSVGSSDTRVDNYAVSTPANGKYGDAVYETSSSSDSPYTNSWNSDYFSFSYTNSPFFIRGGVSGSTSGAGVFSFNGSTGNSYGSSSFRVALPVL